jgi:hypothetical protein
VHKASDVTTSSRFEEGLDGFVEGGWLVVHDEVAGVVDAVDFKIGHRAVGAGVDGVDFGGVGAYGGGVERVEEGRGGLDSGELRAEVSDEVFVHGIGHDGAVGGDGTGGDELAGVGVENE